MFMYLLPHSKDGTTLDGAMNTAMDNAAESPGLLEISERNTKKFTFFK